MRDLIEFKHLEHEVSVYKEALEKIKLTATTGRLSKEGYENALKAVKELATDALNDEG